MLVYGDHEEHADPRQIALAVDREIEALEALPAGLDRHARLVGLLVQAGQLMQGLADAGFADAGFAEAQCDTRTDATERLAAFLTDVGAAVCRSWDSGFTDCGDLPRLELAGDLPGEVTLKLPEGYAFYAVFPEAYAEAARRLVLNGAPRVIGTRSIGTSLAAIVAAALGAPPPMTVRPFGDPSAREIAVDPDLARALLDGDAHYVIVDEGPGLSGSSFASVAEWLGDRGVPRDRIAVLPSHSGAPGAAATAARRQWWGSVQRRVGDFADRWPILVDQWCAANFGAVDGPVEDLSAGSWRNLHYERPEDWPAVVPNWERRKFRVSVGGERLLLKFAGLGKIGEEKLRIARALQPDGFVPEPLGVMHGFLVERWCEDAFPLAPSDRPLREIARYLGARARLLPATDANGASITQLLEMARRNISLQLGETAAARLERWADRVPALERAVFRVRTDNRLDRCEWLRTASGALLKTDAFDHHQAHDLVGCQDIGWDVAGAIAEFDMDQLERADFVRAVEEESGRAVDRELLDLYRIAYAAFRLGQWQLGRAIVSDPAEQRRISSAARTHAAPLRDLLQPGWSPTRLRSLVD